MMLKIGRLSERKASHAVVRDILGVKDKVALHAAALARGFIPIGKLISVAARILCHHS
jgi:hypothetical protein